MQGLRSLKRLSQMLEAARAVDAAVDAAGGAAGASGAATMPTVIHTRVAAVDEVAVAEEDAQPLPMSPIKDYICMAERGNTLSRSAPHVVASTRPIPVVVGATQCLRVLQPRHRVQME